MNFLFEKLDWEKVDLNFLRVKKEIVPSKMFFSKETENKFIEM